MIFIYHHPLEKLHLHSFIKHKIIKLFKTSYHTGKEPLYRMNTPERKVESMPKTTAICYSL